MSPPIRTCLALLTAVLATPLAAAQLHESKLMASDTSGLAFLGQTTAISGDTLASGAPSDDASSINDSGAVYVWVREGGVWQQQAKLVDSDAEENDRFGTALALDGDTLMVGVPNDDYAGSSSQGSVTVFVRSGTTWTEHQTLTPLDWFNGDDFGTSVAVRGDLCLIGSPRDDVGAGSAGSVYLFVRSGGTWTQAGKILASPVVGGREFGRSLALAGDGTTAVVGAWRETHSGFTQAGAAYVFTQQGGSWVQEARLTASDAGALDWFGEAVAIDGDAVVVGAFGDDHSSRIDAGSAYVFLLSGGTWTEQQKLTVADPATDDTMGNSVAVLGDRVFAGVSGDDLPGAADAGSVAVFEHAGGTWTETERLTASDPDGSDFFGGALAVGGEWGGEWIVVGAGGVVAPGGGAGSVAAGAVYVFREVWNDLGAALAGTQGEPQLTGTGDLSAGTHAGVSLGNAHPSAPATLVSGLSTLAAPFKGGVLVPSPDVILPLTTDATGALDVAGTWPPGLPGDVTIVFQFWIADPAGPKGYAASNGLAGVTP